MLTNPLQRKSVRGTWRGSALALGAILALLAHAVAARAEPQEVEDQAPTAGETDPWAALRLLAGTWEGAIDGLLGRGRGLRRYEFIFRDQFLLLRHSSVRPPQEKSPKGDQHQELAVFSFDGERQKIVLREFMIEGVVNRYVCETAALEVVCTTEAVENGPGIRARLTLQIADRYRFVEVYEIAWPGKELALYFTNRWTRLPDLDDRG